MNVQVCLTESDTKLSETLRSMGLDQSFFSGEKSMITCSAAKEQDSIVLAFEDGAALRFADEAAAVDFLYMVICHCRFLQMLTTDFGGMMDILGNGIIHSTDWEKREEVSFYASVLSTHVMPDMDDPEASFQLMNETDDAMMERFSEDSQMILMFGEVEKEHRKLFWTSPLVSD